MENIKRLEHEIAELRKVLNSKESELAQYKKLLNEETSSKLESTKGVPRSVLGEQLPKWAIERYSRQILLGAVGAAGQRRLCAARALVAGAGGLGCPVAAYLAGAGVGTIGLLDCDTVDATNLHRQPLHSERTVGQPKVDSAADALLRINSHIKVNRHRTQLTSANAAEIVSQYDVIVDCSDNVPTAYLLNDASFNAKIPLVSGKALKMEGQLTIYNYRAKCNPNEKDATYAGPCYRCLWPAPPPPAAVGSCSAQGVCGAVCGVIGALQALETIKLLVGATHQKLLVGRMLVFDGEEMTFKIVKLRNRSRDCSVCSGERQQTELIDYEVFCKTKAVEKDLELQVLPPENRISAKKLAEKLKTSRQHHLLIDVRNEGEFHMCRLDGAVNYPIDELDKNEVFNKLLSDVAECLKESGCVTFMCRRGNDSQLAARRVLRASAGADRGRGEGARVTDLAGGLHAWAAHVDAAMPIY